MNLNLNRQKLLVVVAGVAVGLLVLDRVLITPLINTYKAHSLEIVKLRKSVFDGRNTTARGPQTERIWTEMGANALPKDQAQAEQTVIGAIDSWSKANNIEISGFRPQWKRGVAERYSLLECRIDAIGTLQSLTRFMYELEHSPLALRVESVEITSRDDSGSKLGLGLIVSGLRLAPLEKKLP